MTKDYKKILIIDDSEVDREVLKNILSEEFSTTEAENGSAGVEKILKEGNSLDAILLDVSMPVMDGFGVLKRMEENRLNNIPVFLITAEATRENVANAAQYHISGFIRKPYDRAEVLWRLETKLGMLGRNSLTEEDIQETVKYIADLEGIYRRFLKNFGLDCGHYHIPGAASGSFHVLGIGRQNSGAVRPKTVRHGQQSSIFLRYRQYAAS